MEKKVEQLSFFRILNRENQEEILTFNFDFSQIERISENREELRKVAR